MLISLLLLFSANSFATESLKFEADSILYQCSKEEDESDCEEEATNFPEISVELLEEPDFGIKIGEWETSLKTTIPTTVSMVVIKIEEPEEEPIIGVFFSSNVGNDSFQLEAAGSGLYSQNSPPLELALNSFGKKYENRIARNLVEFRNLKIEVNSAIPSKKQIKPSTRAAVSTFLKSKKYRQFLKRKKSLS